MKEKVSMFVTRDYKGNLRLFHTEPFINNRTMTFVSADGSFLGLPLPRHLFPDVIFANSPVRVCVMLEKGGDDEA